MTPQAFLSLLKRKGIKYTVVDRYVDVEGDCDLSNLKLSEIPVQFRVVTGNFDCDNNQLTSLEGSPGRVGEGFYCDHNPVKFTKADITQAMSRQSAVESVIDRLLV